MSVPPSAEVVANVTVAVIAALIAMVLPVVHSTVSTAGTGGDGFLEPAGTSVQDPPGTEPDTNVVPGGTGSLKIGVRGERRPDRFEAVNVNVTGWPATTGDMTTAFVSGHRPSSAPPP